MIGYKLIIVAMVAVSTANGYYFFAENPPTATVEKSLKDASSAVSGAADKVSSEANTISGKISEQTQQQNGETSVLGINLPKPDEVRKQMSSSLGSLVNKMPHAIKSAYHEISPDIEQFGDGLNKALQMTRQEVAHRVEPISQNVSPYLNRAQEAVKPLANEAQRRMTPTIEKLRAGQYREAINDVGSQAAPTIDNLRNQVSGFMSRVANSTQHIGNQGVRAAETTVDKADAPIVDSKAAPAAAPAAPAPQPSV